MAAVRAGSSLLSRQLSAWYRTGMGIWIQNEAAGVNADG